MNNMNKKQKSSIIIASLASIAVAGSLIAGSTYALFTSESKTNIAVTSGKVKVTAVVKDLLTYTGDDLTGDSAADEDKIKLSTDYGLENGYFKNGGTATYNDENGTLTLDKMTPGDKVTFTIDVTNESTVNVKYRTVLKAEADNDLFDGLKVTIDGTSYDGSEVASVYSNLFPGSDPDNIKVSIELPSDADDTYQDKSCSIVSTVEAIQGNAHLGGEDVTNESNLKEAISEGKAVSFSNDIELASPVDVSNGNVVIYGNGHELKVPNTVRNVMGFDKTDYDFDNNIDNDITVTLVDLDIVGPTEELFSDGGYTRGITLWGNTKIKIVLDNCNVSANHYALQVGKNNQNVEIIAKNTTISGYSAILLWSKANVTLTGCTLEGINQWGGGTDDFATVVVETTAGGSNFNFTDCTISAKDESTAIEYLINDKSNSSNFSFTNCEYYHNDDKINESNNYFWG